MTIEKTLGNTTASGAKENVKDIQFWGNGDTFQLISKASSQAEGWMKSTKAMEIDGLGCVVQVTTQQRNPDGSYALAEAVTFVPSAYIKAKVDAEGKVYARVLRSLDGSTEIEKLTARVDELEGLVEDLSPESALGGQDA